MSRYIDADALKPDYVVASTSTNTECYRYVSLEQIMNTPTADVAEVPRWIPVTERLPEDGTEVWVTTDMLFDVTRSRWRKDSNLWCHPYYSDCVLALRPIAWMPYERPEPWKGGAE